MTGWRAKRERSKQKRDDRVKDQVDLFHQVVVSVVMGSSSSRLDLACCAYVYGKRIYIKSLISD